MKIFLALINAIGATLFFVLQCLVASWLWCWPRVRRKLMRPFVGDRVRAMMIEIGNIIRTQDAETMELETKARLEHLRKRVEILNPACMSWESCFIVASIRLRSVRRR